MTETYVVTDNSTETVTHYDEMLDAITAAVYLDSDGVTVERITEDGQTELVWPL